MNGDPPIPPPSKKETQTFEVWSVSREGFAELATQRPGMGPTDMTQYKPVVDDVFVRYADYERVRRALERAVEWGGPMAEAPVRSRPEWFDVARAALSGEHPAPETEGEPVSEPLSTERTRERLGADAPIPMSVPAGLDRFARRHGMTDEQIKYMVNRFLGWRLPEPFRPDAGISFKPEYNVEFNAARGLPPCLHQPTGTNLFDAQQAEAMIRYMVEGMPSVPTQGENP